MSYGWIITGGNKVGKEFDEEERKRDSCVIGQAGPWDLEEGTFRELRNGGGVAFKMADDDEEMVFTGRAIFDEDCDECEPLDDYGTPGLGFSRYWLKDKYNRWERVI